MCARWHRGYAYIGWKIGWKITPIVQISSSHYFADTQHVMRRMEDMVVFFRKTLFLNHIFKQCNFHKTTAGMEHLPLLIM